PVEGRIDDQDGFGVAVRGGRVEGGVVPDAKVVAVPDDNCRRVDNWRRSGRDRRNRVGDVSRPP
ncbi:MAG: hypothetical protein ABEH58_09855, partial [Haloplanus sp.]